LLSEKTQQANVDCSRHRGDGNDYGEKQQETCLTESRTVGIASGGQGFGRGGGRRRKSGLITKKTPGVFLVSVSV
jgi:hypothetical protein